jgi:ABC-type glycerol-3-phosphate transport system substrate-binding protein
MKKLLIIISVLLLVFSVSGCRKKVANNNLPPVTLTYYKLFENEENLSPLFTKFKQQYPHITVEYKKFTDPEKYLETIVSELAEGVGPDIMSVPNTWVAQNYRKLTPAPQDLASEQIFTDVFVNVAADDNLIQGQEFKEVYGIPLYVDTLALFYNDTHFETSIPERGKPASTWTGLANDSVKLSQINTEGEIFKSAIALGTGNVSRAADIFYLLALQKEVDFYNDSFKEAIFVKGNQTEDILDYIVSFAESEKPNYSWSNDFTTESDLIAFVRGDTSMIFGYSHLYKDILNQITLQKRQGQDVIEVSDVQIIEAPQTADSEQPISYASYFTETVSRNSNHSREAWLLLTFLVQQDNLQAYYKKDFKPTSIRTLIPEQKANPIYAPFINQLGYAKTLPIVDNLEYQSIIEELINSSIGQEQKRSLILDAQTKINSLIPNEGAYPVAK